MRFPDFNDDWKETSLGELLSFYPTNSYSWDQLDYETGAIYNVHYGLIHKGLPTICSPNKVKLPLIKEDLDVSKYTMCKAGDLIIADASEDTNDVGKAIEIIECENWEVVAGLHTIHARSKQDTTALGFKGYLFASKNLKGQIRQVAQGTKVYSISAKLLSPLIISLPSLTEQKKIADFLSLIDERIQSCSETIKELKTQKAGLLSLLIYRTDKQYLPLSYFGEMKHGYPFKSTNYDENGTYRIVTISNVSGDRYTDMGKCNCLIELPHDIQPHQILSHNDILISLTGNVGRVSLCLADGDLLNQRVGVFSLYNEAHREYIYQVLSDKKFETSMIAYGQGAAQLNISKSNVEGYLVPYEQTDYQKIADFLSLIDERIEVEEQLLKKYEEQKKYLLRNMFV